MADVPHMHEQVSMVELFEGGLEAINETVRQISNEADCVHHYCLLAVWQTDLPLSCIERLEESILRFKLRATAHVHKGGLTSIGVPDECYYRHGIMTCFLFVH